MATELALRFNPSTVLLELGYPHPAKIAARKCAIPQSSDRSGESIFRTPDNLHDTFRIAVSERTALTA